MQTENLTIVIPTKNEEHFLPSLLESIRSQDCQPREIIVADAGSTDKTRQVALKYNCKVIDGGPVAQGRNRGARQAISDVILFLDADVQLPPGFLRTALADFHDRQLDVAGTLQVPLPTDSKYNDLIHGFIYGSANVMMRLMQNTARPFMQVCMFTTKQLYDDIGGFDESLIFGEDSEYAVRATRKGAFGILKRPGKMLVSPRRLQKEGLMLAVKCLYFNLARLFGREFRKQGKLVSYDYDCQYDPPSKS